jgi:hypothetical protein
MINITVLDTELDSRLNDTPRTDALHFGYKDGINMQRHELLKLSRTLERELVEAKEELNDRRKFAYAVEQALDGLKGDYVEIIKELRKDAERYRWLREHICWSSDYISKTYYFTANVNEELDAAIDEAIKECGK